MPLVNDKSSKVVRSSFILAKTSREVHRVIVAGPGGEEDGDDREAGRKGVGYEAREGGKEEGGEERRRG